MKDISIIPASYIVPSDDVTMLKIAGSQTGRIFMGGDNGNIYEFEYHNSEDSWASIGASLLGLGSDAKCRKLDHTPWNYRLTHLLPPLLRQFAGGDDKMTEVVVDDARNVMYGLSKNGFLSTFYLDTPDIPCGAN